MQPQSPIELQKQKERQRRAQRASIAVASFVIWAILAAWCVSAFWQHIDGLGLTYPIIAKIGAVAAEVTVFFLVWWHCFNHHIGVRKAALLLGILLSAAALIHAGALHGMSEAKNAQLETETRLEDRLTRMSEKQMQHTKRRADVAKHAQDKVAEEVKASADKVKDSSILPRWYLDGWMYAALFVLSLVCLGVCIGKMQNNEDIDSNYDGIPDHLQQPQPQYGQPYQPLFAPQYMQPPYQAQPQPPTQQPQPRQAEFPDEVGK